ncbi:hypothetical protein H9P43_006304 [Blastocladiella emersonii ATCC 22665]|nr:hypothetical protein H9P43_006304 [Blastocladiella emersonii ATCC 22665]
MNSPHTGSSTAATPAVPAGGFTLENEASWGGHVGATAYPTAFEHFYADDNDSVAASTPYEMRTLVELRIDRIAEAVRDKQHWARKFAGNATLREKWHAELTEQGADPDHVDYVFRELAAVAEADPTAAGPRNVFVSDDAVPETLRARLAELVQRDLEDAVDPDARDWHPGSNGQVLDLVHPSLFPVVYGRTRVAQGFAPPPPPLAHNAAYVPPADGVSEPDEEYESDADDEDLEAEIADLKADADAMPTDWWKDWSDQNVKLPTDLILYPLEAGSDSEDGDDAADAVPDSPATLLERSVTAIPPAGPATTDLAKAPRDTSPFTSEAYQWMPSDVLVDAAGRAHFTSYINNLHPHDHPDLYGALADVFTAMVPLFERTLTRLRDPFMRRINVTSNDWYPPREDGEDEDEDEEEREVVQPKVPTAPPARHRLITDAAPDPVSLRGHHLQVIVKLANIHLTPDNPKYPGGAWHVEGMENERIVATGLFYYDVCNITTSRLAFRAFVQPPPGNPHNEHEAMRQIYQLNVDDHLNEPMGAVTAHHGRVAVFPNTYQHRVLPFELADKTRNGHRKIAAFFLIDPLNRVTSAASVPPQQLSWALRNEQLVAAALAQAEGESDPEKAVRAAFPGLMTLGEAKEHRSKLMAERSQFVVKHNESVFNVPFNMCEH